MYGGLPAYPPDESALLVGSAWQAGSSVLRWPIARPSDPLDTSRAYGLIYFVPGFEHRVGHVWPLSMTSVSSNTTVFQ